MRYAAIPGDELKRVLGLTSAHVEGDWMKAREWKAVTDANGNEIPNCVFADDETGLTVIREGELLRCREFKAPLTIK